MRQLDGRWKWVVRCHYTPAVSPDQDLAIETFHLDDKSRDLEVDTGLNRRDIGKIEVFLLSTYTGPVSHGYPSMMIYDEVSNWPVAAE